MKTMKSALIAGGAIISISASAFASAPLGGEGLFDPDSFKALFEARARVDGGGDQSWKTAMYTDHANPEVTGGSVMSSWMPGMAQPFELAYDAGTGIAVWSVTMPEPIGQSVITHAFPLSPGKHLAGFRFLASSTADFSVTQLADLEMAVNGSAYTPIPGMTNHESGPGATETTSDMVTLSEIPSTLAIRGTMNFGWIPDLSDIAGDNFHGSVRLYEAALIPAPGAVALLSVAGLVGFGRRRRTNE